MVETSWQGLQGKQAQSWVQIARRDAGREEVLQESDPFSHRSQKAPSPRF